MSPPTILCVHGVGNHGADPSWQRDWEAAIRGGLGRWDEAKAQQATVEFVLYDDLFANAPLTPAGTAQALLKLLGSGLWHGASDLLSRRGRGRIADLRERVRWTAGMVVQWAENSSLRREARRRFLDRLRETRADVVLAHSLGSLVCYDALGRLEKPQDLTFVTFGSQIGNPFVRSCLGGRIARPEIRQWWHLYNPHDDAFTAEIRLGHEPGFEQLLTGFDIAGIGDHDATSYLTHPETVDAVFGGLAGGGGFKSLSRVKGSIAGATEPAKRRALLVGINEYPNEADRLDGCVNDCFLVSSLLQESGFRPEEIRVVFDDRATAKGIRDRLAWLLDGTRPGDQRVFFYSGHGAQVANRGVADAIDREDECLVPYDFDWSPDHAILDDELHDLYSQLPYEADFVMILDCCHSGGLARDGGPRVRGLTPPDDVRHRTLLWNVREQMWEERRLKAPNRSLRRRAEFTGKSGARRRLGRALALRAENREFNEARRDFGHKGPYLPIILQACQEDELSYEYRHGVTSHGAFTYALAQVLRGFGDRKWTFQGLVRAVGEKLERLEYDQDPELTAPRALRGARVPWLGTAGAKARGGRRKRRRK